MDDAQDPPEPHGPKQSASSAGMAEDGSGDDSAPRAAASEPARGSAAAAGASGATGGRPATRNDNVSAAATEKGGPLMHLPRLRTPSSASLAASIRFGGAVCVCTMAQARPTSSIKVMLALARKCLRH